MTTAASVDMAKQSARGRLFVALAAVAWSSAGVLQRELSVDALQARTGPSPRSTVPPP